MTDTPESRFSSKSDSLLKLDAPVLVSIVVENRGPLALAVSTRHGKECVSSFVFQKKIASCDRYPQAPTKNASGRQKAEVFELK